MAKSLITPSCWLKFNSFATRNQGFLESLEFIKEVAVCLMNEDGTWIPFLQELGVMFAPFFIFVIRPTLNSHHPS